MTMAARRRTLREPRKEMLHPNRVKAMRDLRELTQEQLAENSGMAYQTLGKLERGDSRLRWEQAQRLAKALHCSPFELVPEEDGLTEQQLKVLKLLTRMGPQDQARWLNLGAALLDGHADATGETAISGRAKAA